MITTEEFLKKYPTCPVCLEEFKTREYVWKNSLNIITYPKEIIYYYLTCQSGHFTVNYEKNKIINSISILSNSFDIQISFKKDKIYIFYGIQNETETKIVIKNADYTKWMITYDQLEDKLKKLWSIA